MLNKLFYFKSGMPPVTTDYIKELEKDFMVNFQRDRHEFSLLFLEALGGGTLGITWRLHVKRMPFCMFVKTHQKGAKYRETLCKEYCILKQFYKNVLCCDNLVLRAQTVNEQMFIMMDWLWEAQPFSTQSIRELISGFARNHILLNDLQDMYDISDLLKAAKSSLKDLCLYGFYSSKVMSMANRLLEDLEQDLPEIPRILCHGDLADKNIMLNADKQVVVVDWEDAFWGIEGYDYLYWLTFFNHRKYYGDKGVFDVPGLSTERIAGILTMILAIKNAIAFYSGEYVHNQLSMEDRLNEIYHSVGII